MKRRSKLRQGRWRIVIGFLVLIALLPSGLAAANSDLSATRVPGQYIVVFEKSVDHPGALAEAQTDQPGRDLGFIYRHALEGYSATLSSGDVKALRNNPKVKYVAPSRRFKALAQTVPTGIARTYATENATAAIDGIDTRVNADVAIIDTGIDYTHPDLNVYKRADCIPAGEVGTPNCIENAGVDGHGHGTHVAGTIGAIDNGEGVVGVAPGVRLWGVRVLNTQGSGEDAWIVAGIDWVTAHAGEIEVANMSLGGVYAGGNDPVIEALETSVAAGVVYTVAGGNEADDVDHYSPARAPGAITVSALADYDGKPGGEKVSSLCNPSLGADDTMATFSNYGAGVDIAAPGACIHSTLPMGGTPHGKEFGTFSGTSMAAPHVAGAAALLASKNNPNSKADVEAIRNQLVNGGSLNYKDTAPGQPSPLLYLGEKALGTEAITGGAEPNSASATLTGGITPRGVETQFKFEYGLTESYGSVAPVPSGTVTAGAGYTRVSQAISGLDEGTKYHFRLVATNKNGTITGKDEVFTTDRSAFTTIPTDIGETSATMHGMQEISDWPKGEPTTYGFEYGPTKAYGTKVNASEVKQFENYCTGLGCSEEQGHYGADFAHATKPVSGLGKAIKYHYRLWATNSLGTYRGGNEVLRTVFWPNWKLSGEFKNRLDAVSCTEVNVCLGTDGPSSLSWSGKTGKAATIQKEGLELLSDVSCLSAASCMGVGNVVSCFGLDCGKPLIEHWNGEKWTKMSVPALPNGSAGGYLDAVSCPSANWCMAIGAYARDDGGKFHPEYLSMIWNGESWMVKTLPEAPLPGPWESGPRLVDVSCTGPSNCFAVGDETMHWDGSSWSPVAMPSPALPLTSISCSSMSACMAVAAHDKPDKEEGTARRWDGKEWSVVPMGSLTKPAWIAHVESVSCAAAWSCVAVGWGENWVRFNPEWDFSAPIVARWDGKDWAVEGLESPEPLLDVDCESVSHCTTTGSGGAIETSEYTVSVPKPAATTEAATEVGQSKATLTASVDPNNQRTSYWFEYGPTTAYGTSVPISPKDIGFSDDLLAVGQAIGGLKENSIYHYRVVAQSEAGTANGEDATFTTLAACKGTEGKCEWKAQSTPDFSRSESWLTGVSCDSTAMCLAVGNDQLAGSEGAGAGYAEVWNGTNWTTLQVGLGKSVAGVSCASTTWCMAVGAPISGEEMRTFKITYGTSKWSISTETPPLPSGGSKPVLRAVSCTSTTACTAVGSYYYAAGSQYKPLVERWNGTTWSVQSAPNPPEGNALNAMQGVSCASATFCTTVGTYTKSSGVPVPFAESWNGTTWSTMSMPAPSPSVDSTLANVSCNSATACMAVGSYKESTAKGTYKKPLTERWNGSVWTVVSAPSPAEAKGEVRLQGVSCLTSSSCIAVGQYAPVAGTTEFKTLAQEWDGTKWIVRSSPNSSQKLNGLVQVDCVSSFACTAVGAKQPTVGFVSESENATDLVERMNETEWNIQATPDRPRSGYLLTDVSCPSTSKCLGVGNDLYVPRGVVEVWNGSTWTDTQVYLGQSVSGVSCVSTTWCMAVGVSAKGNEQRAFRLTEAGAVWTPNTETPPVPSGGSKLVLRAVSCTSTTACTAVGSYYYAASSEYKPLVERWNGTTWSVQAAPNPPVGSAQNAMLSVSCSTSTSCVTAGTANSAPFAEIWNGTEWTVMTTPNPGTVEGSFAGVSCNSPSSCMAVGSFLETGKGQYKKPLTERWNGSAWTVVSAPSPTEAKGDVTLSGVSCVSAVYCTAVGEWKEFGGQLGGKTVVEYWDGAKWALQTSPNSSLALSSLARVSCSSAIACTAVGSASASPPSTLGQVALAQRYE